MARQEKPETRYRVSVLIESLDYEQGWQHRKGMFFFAREDRQKAETAFEVAADAIEEAFPDDEVFSNEA